VSKGVGTDASEDISERMTTEEAALRLLDLSRGAVRFDYHNNNSKEVDDKPVIVDRFKRKYTANLKTEIGKYALINGVSTARRHFSAKIGRLLPRTSVRDMMIKYQAKHGLMNLPALNPVRPIISITTTS
jgi:hypothetical protein